MSLNNRFELAEASHLLSRILTNAESYPGEKAPKSIKKIKMDPTTDPIKLYMREMGSVLLLSREEEVTLAKKIEKGEQVIIHALCQAPFVLDDILELEEGIREDASHLRRWFEFI